MTVVQPFLEDFEVPAHARGGQVTLNLYDHLAAYAPKRPGAYLRISSDRIGLEAGVDRQLEDAEDSRKRLHWGSFAKLSAVEWAVRGGGHEAVHVAGRSAVRYRVGAAHDL